MLNEAKETIGKANGNGAAEAELDRDMDRLKDDFQALRNDVKSLLESVGQVAKGRSERGMEKGSELADTTTQKAKDAQTYVEDQVRANPLAAIGIALGAGFLISALRR